MDLTGALAALRRWWAVVLVAALLGGGAGLAHTVLAQERYEASTTVFFSLQRGETVGELAQGNTYTLDLVQSYASVATMPIVLDPVVADLGLDASSTELARDVTARAPLGTVLLEITATQPTAERAAAVADAVAARLDGAVTRLSAGREGSGAVTVTTTQPASVPTSPAWPRPVLDVGVGLLGGLLVGIAVALVLGVARARVDSRESLARLTATPLVGSLPDDPRGRTPVVASAAEPLGARSEAYRSLRTNLDFLRASPPSGAEPAVGADGEAAGGTATGSAGHGGGALSGGGQLVVVTSSVSGEGKTTTAANLAASIADTGQRVLLVDADLRRPAVASMLGLEGSVGLTTVLVGRAALGDVVQLWGPGGLRVLTAGEVPPNPSELLASPMMARLMAAVRRDHDVVVLDTAPVLPVTDAALLSTRTDGALVVVDARRTPARKVTETLTRLSTAGAPVLGMVLNRTAVEHDEYYGQRPSRRSWRRRRQPTPEATAGLPATDLRPAEDPQPAEASQPVEGSRPAQDSRPADGPPRRPGISGASGPSGSSDSSGSSGRPSTSSGSVRADPYGDRARAAPSTGGSASRPSS